MIARRIDRNHKAINSTVGDIAKVAKLASMLAALIASWAAPTGLTALAVKLGLIGAPLIMLAAPVAVGVAAVAANISLALWAYSKWRTRRRN